MTNPRLTIAVAVGLAIGLAVVLPIAWLINNRDWGVGLMLLVPFIVYGMMRLARVLEAWARNPPPLPHSSTRDRPPR
ncbi:hypothetical protein OCT51_01115 [Halomonas sp. LR3S48]|uniref:hypothetical protein n=1 Tax=Halomonadaceae TaxID=28256 RepID=UPI0021E4EBAE|nr:hypothetical protein [Halomonas sp. LR3S48]UYG03990.1 hypothetical protein OCT51_01115 [Halomonas sp. LR3S48]